MMGFNQPQHDLEEQLSTQQFSRKEKIEREKNLQEEGGKVTRHQEDLVRAHVNDPCARRS